MDSASLEVAAWKVDYCQYASLLGTRLCATNFSRDYKKFVAHSARETCDNHKSHAHNSGYQRINSVSLDIRRNKKRMDEPHRPDMTTSVRIYVEALRIVSL